MEWTKADLINELAAIHGYRSYLEICTPTTGHLYSAIDRARYPICHRLMYRCAMARIRDDLPIDFRSDGMDTTRVVKDMRARKLRYDVILVDPFHEYDSSIRDLHDACALVSPGGTIIVHDCFPREQAFATPQHKEGSWCGVTYKAYLDVVLSGANLNYCTVDVDFGCGIVRPLHGPPALRRMAQKFLLSALPGKSGNLVRQWERTGKDYDAAFHMLQGYSKRLLNLVTLDEFLAGERAGSPVLR